MAKQKRLSETEIYSLVDAIQLGLRARSCVSELETEDKVRVLDLLSRDNSAERHRQAQKAFDKRALDRSHDCSLTHVLKDIKADLLLMHAHRMKLDAFPVSLLARLGKEPRRRVVEMLVQKLSREELAVFLCFLNEDDSKKISEGFSDALLTELDYCRKKWEAQLTEADRELVMSKASLILLAAFSEEPDLEESLAEMLAGYKEVAFLRVQTYCTELFEHLGLSAQLQELSRPELTRLAGLLPRKILATLHSILEGASHKVHAELLKALPATQRKEVDLENTRLEAIRKKDLRGWSDVLDAIKVLEKTLPKLAN